MGGRDRYTPESLRAGSLLQQETCLKEVRDTGQHLCLPSDLHMHGMAPTLTAPSLTSSEILQSCGPLNYTYLEEINVILVYSTNGQK